MEFPIGGNLRFHKLSPFLIFAALAVDTLAAPRSAIITLSLPSGARQLGMGEAGLATSEDVFATSWNPATLALSPLSDEWALSLATPASGLFNSIAGRTKDGFLSQSEAWASTATELYHYSSGSWSKEWEIPLEGKSLRSVIRTFLGSDQNLDSNVAWIKQYNALDKQTSEEFIGKIKLPWSLVLKDSIRHIQYDDKNGYLWVGTAKGLLRFDGKAWRRYKAELGDREILALAAMGSNIWVGTNEGLFRYQQQTWTRTGLAFAKSLQVPSESAVSDSIKDSALNVTEQGSQVFPALAWDAKNSELWVAVQNVGIARWRNVGGKDSWKLYNTVTDSVIDAQPHTIVIDDSSHVWVGHKGGVSHFNRNKWSRIEFEETQINSMTYGDKALWLATDKGMWRFKPAYFKPGAVFVQEGDKSDKENLGEWEHFHQGTGMIDQNVQRIRVLGSEIWASTGAGVEHFAKARRQAGIFNETLLPSLNIPDLFHLNGALTFPLGDWGTVGSFVNFVSFGESSTTPEDGSNAQAVTFKSYEMVGGLSYGLKLFNQQAVGTNFKFIYSNLMSGVPGQKDAKTFSYAVDLSYLNKHFFINDLSFALGLFNMGPSVYYVDKSKVDPIPLTWKMGWGYNIINLPSHRWLVAFDLNKETLSLDQELNPDPFYISAFKGWGETSIYSAMYNLGTEYTWDNLVALRAGYMNDQPGQREEISAGAGVMVSDIMQADVGVIVYDLNAKGVRQGQWRMSLIFKY